MRTFMKTAGMALVVGGGSLLTLYLAFTNAALAWLALIVTGVLAIGGIVLIVRDTRNAPISEDEALSHTARQPRRAMS
jgi:hypothetical protein